MRRKGYGLKYPTLHDAMQKVRTFRNKSIIALNDGSTINQYKHVIRFENTPGDFKKNTTALLFLAVMSGVRCWTKLKLSLTEILGDSDAEKFPLAKEQTKFRLHDENAHI
jgi:hypothetical protein